MFYVKSEGSLDLVATAQRGYIWHRASTGTSFLCDKEDGEMCYRSYAQMRMIGY
jgi:hypothetical protein